MRRDARRRTESQKWWEDKRVLFGGSAIAIVFVMLGAISIFSSNVGEEISQNETNPNQIISLAPDEEIKENSESASSSIGNKVEDMQVETNTNTNSNSITNISTNNNTNTSRGSSAKENAEKIIEKKENNLTENDATEKNKTMPTSSKDKSNENIKFEWPVKGNILKAFSIDNLLYSSTLQEWTVHNGIDIKADKASSVCAAESGTIKSIKNDPRYGLTVVIEHDNGYKTVYSNLLTAEFVVEGEKISKGQNIGTVGNTANFEVADDFHLHFEILKDDEYVDPMIYLK